jgi:transcriptional regulator with XRE-family HTH domain
MQTGRKILNLRCDRKISQQDLARACDITPSALSKIEAGINSPRANIIWRIARNLGVTVEYLLDEEIPYPHRGYTYRHDLLAKNVDPSVTVRVDATREEKAFLDALRQTNEVAREVAYSMPEAPVETVRLMHFLLNHSQIQNPTHSFFKSFESLLTTGAVGSEGGRALARRGRVKKRGPGRPKGAKAKARK